MIFMIRRQPGVRRRRLATIAAVPDATVACHADAALLRRHALDVGDGHVLHVEQWGAAHGVPALVLHGGPGSGCTPWLRRFFDPARFRIVCPDQRGAGRSLPAGGVEANTTAHLLADLRRLRAALGIERWLVVGGSWGATLALAHALDAPDAVSGLLLRGSFLARPQDIERFFDGAPAALAAGWRSLPALPAGDPAARRLVDAWARHERRRSGAAVSAAPPDLDALAPRYRVQSHYLQHGCWLQQPPLLERVAALPAVPTLLLHGSEDRICPPDGALALQARLPHAGLRWAAGAGHDPADPAMAALMRQALDGFARDGHFGGASALAA
jgi:proline iminopeptidase